MAAALRRRTRTIRAIIGDDRRHPTGCTWCEPATARVPAVRARPRAGRRRRRPPRDALPTPSTSPGTSSGSGYRRYWVAEHHNMPGIASSAPAVLIGHLADATTTMRVGSGGVMLPNHAPLVVAEQFGMLEALHPGRIDLGIGRAPGHRPASRRQRCAARPTRCPRTTSPSSSTSCSATSTAAGPRPPVRAITAVPGARQPPPMWLLGSSGYSAQVAGAARPAVRLRPPLQRRRTRCRRWPCTARRSARRTCCSGRTHGRAPSVVCAETDEHARYLAGPGGAVVPAAAHRPARAASRRPEEAAAYPYTRWSARSSRTGWPTRSSAARRPCGAAWRTSLERTEADELMITTMVHDPADRWPPSSSSPSAAGSRSTPPKLPRRSRRGPLRTHPGRASSHSGEAGGTGGGTMVLWL